MKLATKKSAGKTSSTAKVVDGKLILSCPEAINPVVWQMDLAQAKSSALEVREVKGNFVLTLKTTKGESVEVAPFATREDAVAALMATSSALENASGQIRPAGSVAAGETVVALPPATEKKQSRWIGVVLGALMILILLGVWGSLAPRAPMSVGTGAASEEGVPQTLNDGDEPGVPLNADEFLMKR